MYILEDSYLYDLDVNTKWKKYLTKIDDALLKYTDCVQDDCSCHAR